MKQEDGYLSANRLSKYRKTPITLAASTSMAARPLRPSLTGRSRGLGRVCSFGSHVEISSLAREKFGCRERVVKASAQVRVKDGDEDWAIEGGGGRGPGFRGAVVVEGALCDMQHPPSAPFPPQQQPAVGVPLPDREAASVLQKKVLCGSVRHCAHVPGPLAHGLVAWLMGGRVTSERTSPSEGGGVNWDRVWMGASRLFSKALGRPRGCSCVAISAQIHGVPC